MGPEAALPPSVTPLDPGEVLLNSLLLMRFEPVGFVLSRHTFAKPQQEALLQVLRFLLGPARFAQCWPVSNTATRSAFRRTAQARLQELEMAGLLPPGSARPSLLLSAGGRRVQVWLCHLADVRLRLELDDAVAAERLARGCAEGKDGTAAAAAAGDACGLDLIEFAPPACDASILELAAAGADGAGELRTRLKCERVRASRGAARLRRRLGAALADERACWGRAELLLHRRNRFEAEAAAEAAEAANEAASANQSEGETAGGTVTSVAAHPLDGSGGREALTAAASARRAQRAAELQQVWDVLEQHGREQRLAPQRAAVAECARLELEGAVPSLRLGEHTSAGGTDLSDMLAKWSAGLEVLAGLVREALPESDGQVQDWSPLLPRLREATEHAENQDTRLRELSKACATQSAAVSRSCAVTRKEQQRLQQQQPSSPQSPQLSTLDRLAVLPVTPCEPAGAPGSHADIIQRAASTPVNAAHGVTEERTSFMRGATPSPAVPAAAELRALAAWPVLTS